MACENYLENEEVLQNFNSNLEKDEDKDERNKKDSKKKEFFIDDIGGDNRGGEKELEVTDITSGRPVSLLSAIGLSDLLEKWPAVCVPMGGRVGFLTAGTYVRTYVHVYVQVLYVFVHVYIHKHAPSYTHTHTHTHNQDNRVTPNHTILHYIMFTILYRGSRAYGTACRYPRDSGKMDV